MSYLNNVYISIANERIASNLVIITHYNGKRNWNYNGGANICART